ncbi:MAG: hypothetical protein JWN41_1216, partial [Thermoleophilia bacterium]|nr:hypothetical protein [Thermoleophilia bacterium]
SAASTGRTLGMGSTPQLNTVGYEGRAQHDLLRILDDAEIDRLVDVRIRAQSRKPGFSKSTLTAGLAEIGIAYEHLRDLGTPLEIRAQFREAMKVRGGGIDGPLLAQARDEYRAYLHSHLEARLALEHLADLVGRERIAILCFEHDHRACHRAVIAEELQASHGITAVHLASRGGEVG